MTAPIPPHSAHSAHSAHAAQEALSMALGLGFDLAGLIPLGPPRDADHFRAWLAAGHQADMNWLERNQDRILDPSKVLFRQGGDDPQAQGSLLVVGLGHSRPAVELQGGGRIARYAAGRDYHNRMGKLLRKLARGLSQAGLAGRSRGIVDAGPIMERSHGAQAGLGFPSKAANLLHPVHGPWFFLGELLLDSPLGLEPTPAPTPPPGSCGTCRACIDACPTDAIRSPGVVDSRLCISYQTIENRGPVPRKLRAKLGSWVFGCDICSEVCPWGTKAPDRSSEWGTHRAVEQGGLLDWLALGREGKQESFGEQFKGSPLSRPKREGLARNAAIVLGNRQTEGAQPALIDALDQSSALVRETAGWALAHGYGKDRATQPALERAWRREADPEARCGLAASLEGDLE